VTRGFRSKDRFWRANKWQDTESLFVCLALHEYTQFIINYIYNVCIDSFSKGASSQNSEIIKRSSYYRTNRPTGRNGWVNDPTLVA
jgi:hypothetical protein